MLVRIAPTFAFRIANLLLETVPISPELNQSINTLN